MTEDYKLISEQQLERAVKKGVEQAFTASGIDIRSPFENQKDFAHLRDIRLSRKDNISSIKGAVIKKAVDVGLIGLIVGIWNFILHSGGS